ncbi:hypothetical protein RchiOBHm_Chr7g0224851 [Rosa chinensis]|uniref:Uncharacterized protein n=1 Tax=Rosa chinensis TaxID=74649 RepID=A0A2P6PDY2_ROSCH|nr:hypothetical protein RchiOBHm_Chr7g0224851 [Rosa chinensis]
MMRAKFQAFERDKVYLIPSVKRWSTWSTRKVIDYVCTDAVILDWRVISAFCSCTRIKIDQSLE